MAQLALFLVVDSKTAVVSDTDPTSYAFPDLCQGDTTSIAITLLKRVSQVAAPFFSKLQASQYSIRMGLFTRAGVLLSYIAAASFTADDAQAFTAILPLNTANIDAAVTTAAGDLTNVVLQIEATEIATTAVTTVFTKTDVKILKDYLSNATTAVAAGETGATQGWVTNGFMPVFWATPSVWYVRSAGGKMFKKYYDENGIEQTEDYVP